MGKQKITKDMVVEAAFSILREEGRAAVTVARIGERLHCSTQPIYTYCRNMDGVLSEVAGKARAFIASFLANHQEGENVFRSTGRAFTLLAKKEPHLFAFFVSLPREISSLHELYALEADPEMACRIAKELGISTEDAKALHLHMLIYTIGLGTILAASHPGFASEEAFLQLDDAYAAFRGRARERK